MQTPNCTKDINNEGISTTNKQKKQPKRIARIGVNGNNIVENIYNGLELARLFF